MGSGSSVAGDSNTTSPPSIIAVVVGWVQPHGAAHPARGEAVRSGPISSLSLLLFLVFLARSSGIFLPGISGILRPRVLPLHTPCGTENLCLWIHVLSRCQRRDDGILPDCRMEAGGTVIQTARKNTVSQPCAAWQRMMPALRRRMRHAGTRQTSPSP